MSVNKKLLVFTDLDGSLLDHYSYSFAAAIPMLNELQKRQDIIIPNTSKTFAELIQICQNIKLNDPFIVENGAAVYIPIGYFDKQPSDTEQQGQYWVKSFCPPRDHWLNLLDHYAGEYADCFTGFSQMNVQQISYVTGLSEDNANLASQRQYTEPLLWQGDNKQQQEFIELMHQHHANVLKGGRFLHVSGKCDKGQAMLWLIKTIAGQYPHQTLVSIAIGDSGNDVAMLNTADIAVQIRSPLHDFPSLNRTHQTYQSAGYGPVGWAECMTKIISNNKIGVQ